MGSANTIMMGFMPAEPGNVLSLPERLFRAQITGKPRECKRLKSTKWNLARKDWMTSFAFTQVELSLFSFCQRGVWLNGEYVIMAKNNMDKD